MKNHDNNNNNADKYLLEQSVIECAQCFIDQAGPVIKRDNLKLADRNPLRPGIKRIGSQPVEPFLMIKGM